MKGYSEDYRRYVVQDTEEFLSRQLIRGSRCAEHERNGTSDLLADSDRFLAWAKKSIAS
ncbi:MAG TPA: hypothetical protein VN541_05995 [Tepidisphaeraceae bacterium]|nr:hypothetical protein [Tepidisphaeraceae bacterium]